jgi:cytochrome b6-f complex iron-sulfur subunit
MKLNRREFITIGTAAAACTCAGTGFNGCKMISGTSDTPEAPEKSYKYENHNIIIDLKRVSALKKTGSSIKLAVENGSEKWKLLVICLGKNKYRAFENRCTHGKREIEYDHGKKQLQCVSFGHSKFDLDGKVAEGPAEKPVIVYPSVLEGDQLVIAVR